MNLHLHFKYISNNITASFGQNHLEQEVPLELVKHSYLSHNFLFDAVMDLQ